MTGSPKRRFLQKTADFRRFTPSPGNSSIWRAQETAEDRRFSQETADFRRLCSVTLGASPLARPYRTSQSCLYVEISRHSAFRGTFLEICFRTPGTSLKLLQKSALQCVRLCSVLLILHGRVSVGIGMVTNRVQLACAHVEHVPTMCMKGGRVQVVAFLWQD